MADKVLWTEDAKALAPSADPVTMALRFRSAETWNAHVIQGVLGRQRTSSVNYTFMSQAVNLTPNAIQPGNDEFGVCFGWNGRERTISQGGNLPRSSTATVDIPQPVQFTSTGVTHIDELVIWPVKGTDAHSALAIREGEIGEANSRLRRSGEWYDSVRAEAAGRGEP